MLTFEQIKDLIDQVASHRLGGFELERSGFRLKIDGLKPAVPAQSEAVLQVGVPSAAGPPVAPAPPADPAPTDPAVAGSNTAQASDPDDPPAGSHVMTSPIVGTFYRSPNPDSPPFAEVGKRVTAGQVLCIVEAMKLMNEIESDVSGTIVKAYVENAQPVEFGEPLFAIKAD